MSKIIFSNSRQFYYSSCVEMSQGKCCNRWASSGTNIPNVPVKGESSWCISMYGADIGDV